MEIFLPAVLGELATRSVSFVINKYSKLPVQAMEINLERILLRAQVIVEEAEGRHITNQGMLRQLRMLRDAMYQGFYVLDTLQYRAFQEDGAGDNKDVVYGGVKPQGAFKALAWKSPLPPYRCYINIYEIQQLQTRLVKKRRSE
ncbi:hypothetical protein QYE76_000120 [Lolium multiflorum]|uniref:Disease resistance N-terminal domain-containing protein n=1 Tax=Lolium multiflorum TaxID=4521 RepID=A0AAD8QF47_LOLMU|nr:hypothetical protein QYE76_000120 [Lolium multiflorum]